MSEPRHERLSVLLHEQVDHLPLHGSGWPQISRRIHRRRQVRRLAVSTAALGLAVGGVLLATLPGDRSGSVATVALGERAGAAPVRAAAEAALALAQSAGVPGDAVRAELPAPGVDSTRIELRRADGAVVSEVLLTPPGPAGTGWQVVSASSPAMSVRSPAAGSAFDPPLSVAFRTAQDAQVTVSLRAEGGSALASWTERVDGGTDWSAQLNYPVQEPRTAGLVLVAAWRGGRIGGLVAIPVRLGSAG